MQSKFGFKSRRGKHVLVFEKEVTATEQSSLADELKKSGKYARVLRHSIRYSGVGIGGSPVAVRFFVLAFA